MARPSMTPSIDMASLVQPINFNSTAPLATMLPFAFEVFFVRLIHVASALPLRTVSTTGQQFGLGLLFEWLHIFPL